MTSMFPQVKTHLPKGAAFPVRHPEFVFADLDKYWSGDPFVTHFMNTLSGLFPDGEQFFVDSLKYFRAQIKDPQLQRDIAAFIGQEAVHSKEHTVFNRHADAQGMDILYVEKMTARLMALWKKADPETQLALTVATEHLTAVLGHALMESEYLRDQLKHEQMLRMWLWHAIEENEHKTVAFDALKEINPSYALRVSAYVAMLSCGIPLVLACQLRQMFKDENRFNLTTWSNGFATVFGRKGLLTSQLGRLADYFRPSFHPLDHDTVALMADWKTRLNFSDSSV